MDRRTFLKGARAKTITLATNMPRGLQSGLDPYTGPWTTNEVAHLLKRAMFGAKKSDIDYFLSRSCSDAVDELLQNIPAVDPPLRDYGVLEDQGIMYEDTAVPRGQTWVDDLNNTINDPGRRAAINSARIESLRRWWTGLILNQNRSINEKMVMFWHHHFSVQREEVNNATHLYRHHNLLRNNVLGNVRELAKKVTVDPAMLLHLNGYLNSKRAPDENYARELQELFTVGKGNDSLYTESDVIEAAKALTGWRIHNTTLTAYLNTEEHDMSTKRFSAFYHNATITGSANGSQEVDQLIDMIFSTTESARFICRKLYKWFVYYDIDAFAESNVIAPLAEILRQNDFQVSAALSVLLKSEHFFDKQNQACYIKSAFDFVAGALRELDISIPAYTDYENGYPLFDSICERAAQMQQDLFQPPDVSGWPSYYQEPMYYELWVNSNTLPRRAAFTDALIEDGLVDLRGLAQRSANPADPNQLISDLCELLLRYPLSSNSRNYIKTNFLLEPSGNDSSWTNTWNAGSAAVINEKLGNALRFIMNLPEFHLC
ncbi:MAG TPA: DUF1800 domain-containing protein [Flavitalea sp.]|nr:DUF1800 domain-containing protein [Flavitalea sp.]